MTRTTEEILMQLEEMRQREEERLIRDGNEVLKWEILEPQHNISPDQARKLARAVHEDSNALRLKGVTGLRIPKQLLQKDTYIKFSEDYPILFKYALSPNPKVLECVDLLALAQIRADQNLITEQEKRNIQERLVIDYAPLLVDNLGHNPYQKSLGV